MTEQNVTQLDQLVEQYLGLESMEATFELVELCGTRIDMRALPLLNRRLHEEEVSLPFLETRGYIRMREKCEQLVASLQALIGALEETDHERAGKQPEAK
jgi:hypothetical protein